MFYLEPDDPLEIFFLCFYMKIKFINKNRSEIKDVPELSTVPTAWSTGPEKRSTGVRDLESSNVMEAPNWRSTLATARWPKCIALWRLLHPDSPSWSKNKCPISLQNTRTPILQSTGQVLQSKDKMLFSEIDESGPQISRDILGKNKLLFQELSPSSVLESEYRFFSLITKKVVLVFPLTANREIFVIFWWPKHHRVSLRSWIMIRLCCYVSHDSH